MPTKPVSALGNQYVTFNPESPEMFKMKQRVWSSHQPFDVKDITNNDWFKIEGKDAQVRAVGASPFSPRQGHGACCAARRGRYAEPPLHPLGHSHAQCIVCAGEWASRQAVRHLCNARCLTCDFSGLARRSWFSTRACPTATSSAKARLAGTFMLPTNDVLLYVARCVGPFSFVAKPAAAQANASMRQWLQLCAHRRIWICRVKGSH